jgi:hypothetical protein
MGKLNLWTSDVEQTCRHIDVVNSIYDEDYKKTNILFGIFSFIRRFKLRHDIYVPKNEYKETNITGFRKKIN